MPRLPAEVWLRIFSSLLKAGHLLCLLNIRLVNKEFLSLVDWLLFECCEGRIFRQGVPVSEESVFAKIVRDFYGFGRRQPSIACGRADGSTSLSYLDVRALILHHIVLHSPAGHARWTNCPAAPVERRVKVRNVGPAFVSKSGPSLKGAVISGKLLVVFLSPRGIGCCNLLGEGKFTLLEGAANLPETFSPVLQRGTDDDPDKNVLVFKTKQGIDAFLIDSSDCSVHRIKRGFETFGNCLVYDWRNVFYVRPHQGAGVLAARGWSCPDQFQILSVSSLGELVRTKCRFDGSRPVAGEKLAPNGGHIRFRIIEPLRGEAEEECVTFVNRVPCRRRFKVLPLSGAYAAVGLDVEDRDAVDIVDSAFIFRDDVFLLLPAFNKNLLVSTDGFHYRCYRPLVAFRGGFVLFLGTSNGLVCAYPVGEASDLLHLDLEGPFLKFDSKFSESVQSISVSKITRWERGLDVVEIAVCFGVSVVIISKPKFSGELTVVEEEPGRDEECLCDQC